MNVHANLPKAILSREDRAEVLQAVWQRRTAREEQVQEMARQHLHTMQARARSMHSSCYLPDLSVPFIEIAAASAVSPSLCQFKFADTNGLDSPA